MSMEIFIEGPGDKKIMKGGIELQGESFSDQIFLKYYGILKKNSGGGCGSGNEKYRRKL